VEFHAVIVEVQSRPALPINSEYDNVKDVQILVPLELVPRRNVRFIYFYHF